MTIVTANFVDITGVADTGTVDILCYQPRTSSDGTKIVTSKTVTVTVTAGTFTSPNLDPGTARFWIKLQNWRKSYDVIIPASGTVSLFSLKQFIIDPTTGKPTVQGPPGVQGEKGDTGLRGPVGPANVLGIGTVTTGATGSPASASVSGDYPDQKLNLTLPRGLQGEQGVQGIQGFAGSTGPANTLSIGTVTSDTTPGASITGASPTQTLNLVLAKGDKGDTGDTGPSGAPATAATLGSVQLAGDLGGTATSPTVPNKVDKSTTNSIVYGNSATGVPGTIPYSGSATAQTIMYRGTGGVVAVGEPTSSTHATTKNYVDTSREPTIAAGTTAQYYRGDKSWQALNAAAVGLGSANNTADAAKPVSTATQTALNLKADLVAGLIPQAQIPAIALTEFLGAVSTQAAMLALSGQRGDWCTRTDRGTDFQLIAEPSSTLANWRERTYPASPVSSVAGRLGAVTLSAVDVTDSTATGRSVLTATDGAAVRTVIGAGTSNLALGTTGTTAAAGNDSRLTNTRTPSANTVPCDFTFAVQSGTRAVGLGDLPEGIRFGRPATVSSIVFSIGTADASGTNTVALYKNGALVGTAVTLTGTSAGATAIFTGPASFAVGDYLQINVTAVGTTPGLRLYAHVIGTWD